MEIPNIHALFKVGHPVAPGLVVVVEPGCDSIWFTEMPGQYAVTVAPISYFAGVDDAMRMNFWIRLFSGFSGVTSVT